MTDETRDDPRIWQIVRAERLIAQMNVSGDDEKVTVADILDDLACAGLMLVPDPDGIASAAYMVEVGSVPLNATKTK